MPAGNAPAHPRAPQSWLSLALWTVPLALLAAVVYVFVAALKAEPAPEQVPSPYPLPQGEGEKQSRSLPQGAGEGRSFPLTIVEPGGRKVLIPAKPMRILPADCGMADILSALVDPVRLAALPATVDGFAGAKEFFVQHKQIPRFERFQAETLLSLKPDLILAVIFRENSAADLLEQHGVPVLRFEQFRTFQGIRESLLTVGAAVGEERKARALADDFDKRLAAVEKAVAGRPRPRALWYSKYDQGFAVGAGESQDEILRRAGARNAAAELSLVGHVRFTFEQMLKLRPDYIVVGGEEGLASNQARIVLHEPLLAELPAVKERRIAVVPDRYASAVSQHVVNAVEILARQLHPELETKDGRITEVEQCASRHRPGGAGASIARGGSPWKGDQRAAPSPGRAFVPLSVAQVTNEITIAFARAFERRAAHLPGPSGPGYLRGGPFRALNRSGHPATRNLRSETP